MEVRKISRRHSRSSFYVSVLQRTATCTKIYNCRATVLLIKPFVCCRSRCRRRRGLLKFPSVTRYVSVEIRLICRVLKHLLREDWD